MKKGDKLLCIALLLVIVLGMGIFIFQPKNTENLMVLVYQDNELIHEYPFGVENSINVYIDESEENYNTIMINEDYVDISVATCPDELCVKTPSINRGNQSIVCLPHKVLVKLEEKTGSEIIIDSNEPDLTTGLIY